MTTFNADYNATVQLQVRPVLSIANIVVDLKNGANSTHAIFPSTDGPAIALAVMEAGQHETQNGDPGSADYARNEAINWLMTARDRTAKEADTAQREEIRNERRDALAEDLGDDGETYDECAIDMQRAIDRIIDLENQE